MNINKIIIPRRKFVQVSCSDRYGHLYFELDVATTFGHGVVVATTGHTPQHSSQVEKNKQ